MKWRPLKNGTAHFFWTRNRVRSICGQARQSRTEDVEIEKRCWLCFEAIERLNMHPRRADRLLKAI